MSPCFWSSFDMWAIHLFMPWPAWKRPSSMCWKHRNSNILVYDDFEADSHSLIYLFLSLFIQQETRFKMERICIESWIQLIGYQRSRVYTIRCCNALFLTETKWILLSTGWYIKLRFCWVTVNTSQYCDNGIHADRPPNCFLQISFVWQKNICISPSASPRKRLSSMLANWHH